MELLSVKIKIKEEEYPDYSFLGKFTDDIEPGVIRTDTWEFMRWEFGKPIDVPAKRRDYRFFKPEACGEKVGTEAYYKYAKQDAKRMRKLLNGHWCYVGIWAEAEIVVNSVIQKIRSGGIWGIESDCKEYIEEIKEEELGALKNILVSIGITKEEFNDKSIE